MTGDITYDKNVWNYILHRTIPMCFCVHFTVNFWFTFLFFPHFFFFHLSQWSFWVFRPLFLFSKIFLFFSNSLFFLLVLYGLTSLTPSILLFCFVCLVLLHDMLCCYCYICGLTSLLEALRFQRTSLPCTPRLFTRTSNFYPGSPWFILIFLYFLYANPPHGAFLVWTTVV